MSESADNGISRYVAINTATNTVRTVLTALVGLLLVPYFIGELGIAAYGLLPLATSVTSYVMIISDELTKAFSRYLILSIHGGDKERSNSVYTTTIIGLFRIVLLVLPVVALVSLASPYIFSTGDIGDSSIQIMFFLVLASALLFSFSSCFNGVFMASNKMYALHSARIVYTLVQLAFILVLFECVGPSLEYIGVAYLLSACLFTVLIWAVSKRINPDLRYRRHLYDPHLLKEMGGLGMWTILTTIGVLMFIQTSLVLVNIFLGEHEGGSFALITIMISMTNTTCMTLTTIIAPLLYHQYARGDIGTLTAISKASMRFIGLLMAFPVAYLCIFATQILELWSKGEFSGSTDILFIMFVVQIGVCAVSTLEVIPIIYLKIRPVAIATVLFGLINIVGTVLVLQFTDWGIIGAAAVWTVTMLALNFGYYPLFMSRLLSLKWHTFLKPLVPGYLAMAACFAVGLTVTHFWTLPTTWAAVLISFSVLFVIYLMVAFTMGLGKEDKKLIMKVMPNVVKKLVARHTAEK